MYQRLVSVMSAQYSSPDCCFLSTALSSIAPMFLPPLPLDLLVLIRKALRLAIAALKYSRAIVCFVWACQVFHTLFAILCQHLQICRSYLYPAIASISNGDTIATARMSRKERSDASRWSEGILSPLDSSNVLGARQRPNSTLAEQNITCKSTPALLDRLHSRDLC